MQLFVVFVIGAVIVGAGAMLSPAWPTRQPRIGLAASFSLALLVGGAVWWAQVFGWDTLVIDYMMFALVSFVVLGGTLSSAQARAEAKGEELADADMGWTGPHDLVFFALVGLIALLPLIWLPLPPGTDVIGTGLQALTARLGGTLDTLAPLLADVQVLHAPGVPAIAAYLSQQMNQPIPYVLYGLSAVAFVLAVWAIYDLGSEIGGKALGRTQGLALLISPPLLIAHFGASVTLMMGWLFLLTALAYLFRLGRGGGRLDWIGSGLMVGAALIVDAAVGLAALLAYAAWLIALLVVPGPERPTRAQWLRLTFGVGAAFLFGAGPWLLNATGLMLEFAGTPGALPRWEFVSSLLVLLPGGILGAAVGWITGDIWQRRAVALAVVWLVGGLLAGILLPGLPLLGHLAHPGDVQIASFAPALTLLNGFVLLWLWRRFVPNALQARLRRAIWGILAGGAAIVALALFGGQASWDALRGLLPLPDVQATRADRDALLWLRDNAPADARILNDRDGLWVAVLAERAALVLPDLHTLPSVAADANIEALWRDFDAAALQAADVTHIFVPEGEQPPAADALPGWQLAYDEAAQVWSRE